jgi:hypothetical protein
VASYEYKVIPFLARADAGDSFEIIAVQLQKVIDEHAAQGWEFLQLASVRLLVKAGCFQRLQGKKDGLEIYDQLIFRKPST